MPHLSGRLVCLLRCFCDLCYFCNRSFCHSSTTSDVLWVHHTIVRHACISPCPRHLQALFQRTELVDAAVDEQLLRLYGSTQVPYGSMHLRIGGLEGESEMSISFNRMSKLSYFLESVSCLNHISAAAAGEEPANSTSSSDLSPAKLVVCDNNYLRSKILTGVLPGLVAPSYSAVHLDVIQDSDVQVGGLGRAGRIAKMGADRYYEGVSWGITGWDRK